MKFTKLGLLSVRTNRFDEYLESSLDRLGSRCATRKEYPLLKRRAIQLQALIAYIRGVALSGIGKSRTLAEVYKISESSGINENNMLLVNTSVSVSALFYLSNGIMMVKDTPRSDARQATMGEMLCEGYWVEMRYATKTLALINVLSRTLEPADLSAPLEECLKKAITQLSEYLEIINKARVAEKEGEATSMATAQAAYTSQCMFDLEALGNAFAAWGADPLILISTPGNLRDSDSIFIDKKSRREVERPITQNTDGEVFKKRWETAHGMNGRSDEFYRLKMIGNSSVDAEAALMHILSGGIAVRGADVVYHPIFGVFHPPVKVVMYDNKSRRLISLTSLTEASVDSSSFAIMQDRWFLFQLKD